MNKGTYKSSPGLHRGEHHESDQQLPWACERIPTTRSDASLPGVGIRVFRTGSVVPPRGVHCPRGGLRHLQGYRRHPRTSVSAGVDGAVLARHRTEFRERWHFPNCVAAIDGKHFTIHAPAGSGSEFFNYKHQFSIVLMAAVDAFYNLPYVAVGSVGRESDGGIFRSLRLTERWRTEDCTCHIRSHCRVADRLSRTSSWATRPSHYCPTWGSTRAAEKHGWATGPGSATIVSLERAVSLKCAIEQYCHKRTT